MKTKRLILAFIVFAACGAAALSCAKESQPQYEHPMLSLEPTNVDFGAIAKDDPIAFHEVSLSAKNIGKETLEISDVELPEGFKYEFIPPRRVIEGGEKAILKITMDVRHFFGTIALTGYVVSNSPEQPRVPIALTAQIEEQQASGFSEADAPDIEFEHRAFDFGPISRSKMVEHQFPFKNAGKKPLKIVGVDTMCMCVTAYPTKIEIAPGETAAIVARLEPWKYDGEAPWKALGITTNDPDEQIVNVSVAANIIDEAFLEPAVVLLPHVQLGQAAKAQAKLLQRGSQALSITRIKSSSPNIEATASPLEGDDVGFLIEVTVGSQMPAGKFDEVITIGTNYKNYSSKAKQTGQQIYKDFSRLSLPVKGLVSGSISIAPQQINFGSCAPGQKVTRTLTLTSADSNLEIQSVSCDNSAFRAVAPSGDAGKRCEISVEFAPEPPEREINAELLIVTKQTELRVPLFAAVKQAS